MPAPGYANPSRPSIPAFFAVFAYPESAFFGLDLVLAYAEEELDSAGIGLEDSLWVVTSETWPLDWRSHAGGDVVVDAGANTVTALNVTHLSLRGIAGDTFSIGICAYIPGDINNTGGADEELVFVILRGGPGDGQHREIVLDLEPRPVIAVVGRLLQRVRAPALAATN